MKGTPLRMVALALALGAAVLPASAEPPGPYPLPDPGVAHTSLVTHSCGAESAYEQPNYYGADCMRLHVVYGPFLAKPGQNDILIQPVIAEKPLYDAYAFRRKPGLVQAASVSGAETNFTPPVEEIHLHHGTWIASGYGSGPIWASGEEKTIQQFPEGYGVLIKGSDQWQFLHMIHNATAVPRLVYVTEDIDIMARSVAETKYGMKNTRQIWLDVGGGQFHPQYNGYLLNPVFNAQRGFGHIDTGSFYKVPAAAGFADGSNKRVCYFPKENCARYNSEGTVSAQQGLDVSADGVMGMDLLIGNDQLGAGVNDGTLILMGGHVHPGGIRDEVSLVRGATRDSKGIWQGGVEKPIHISDTIYWDHANPALPTGTPTSWDFSMTGTGEQLGWRIRVKRGDILRLNGVYDTDRQSTYEQMGIVMTWVRPGDTTGLDVFSPNVIIDPGFPTTAVLPPGITATCTPGPNGLGQTVLCLRGTVTRPSLPANQNHGFTERFSLPTLEGPMVTQIDMAGFSYGQADLGIIGLSGIPRVKLGQPLRFFNEDTAAYVWHTVTRCAAPCDGPLTVDYPYANGGTGSPTDVMDFDSSELGVGLAPAQRLDWMFTPTATGVYTFFCRIHPQMRGAFKVVP